MEAGTLELPQIGRPLEAQEEFPLLRAPALRPLECRAQSDLTMSDGGLLRAASPSWTSKDSVRVSGYYRQYSWDIRPGLAYPVEC